MPVLELPPISSANNTYKLYPSGGEAHEKVDEGMSTPNEGDYIRADVVPKTVDFGYAPPGASKKVSNLLVRFWVSSIYLAQPSLSCALYINGAFYRAFNIGVGVAVPPHEVYRSISIDPSIVITSMVLTVTSPISPVCTQITIYTHQIDATYTDIVPTKCIDAGFKHEWQVEGSIPEC